MSDPKPLTTEEIAEGRRLLAKVRGATFNAVYGTRPGQHEWEVIGDWLIDRAERLLATAARLALVERRLAEADAVIAWWFDSPWDEPPTGEMQRAATGARERHAARQKKEPTP